jgi:hypothetical protein
MARAQPLRCADLCANPGKLSESEPSQHTLYFGQVLTETYPTKQNQTPKK